MCLLTFSSRPPQLYLGCLKGRLCLSPKIVNSLRLRSIRRELISVRYYVRCWLIVRSFVSLWLQYFWVSLYVLISAERYLYFGINIGCLRMIVDLLTSRNACTFLPSSWYIVDFGSFGLTRVSVNFSWNSMNVQKKQRVWDVLSKGTLTWNCS